MTASKKSTSKKSAPKTAAAQASPPAPPTATRTAETPAPAPQATQAPQTPTPAAATPVTSVSVGNRGGKKVVMQTSLVALIAGLQANFAPDFVFDLPTGPATTSALVATFAQYVTAAETTKTQYQSWRTAVAAEKPIEQQVTSTRALVKTALLAKYGKQSPQLLQFGITPYKVPVRTAAAKTVGAAKASATRKSSGKGKKPKLTVTATTTGVSITSEGAPVAGSAPAAAATKPTAS